MSGALWNNGYFNNLHYNNLQSLGLARERGKTCTLAGYITLKVDGAKRKLAVCK